ncbi:MAG: hypothetical protein ACI3XM_10410 [Eubacteriales bacterium]
MKKSWLTYLIAAALALLVVWICISLEAENNGTGPGLRIKYLSDGFFLSAVMFLGCGILSYIADAGNFLGIQFLGYTLVCLFSFRKERFRERKSYFTYCMEKQKKQKEKGYSIVKRVMVHVGLGCLALSLIFVYIFYRVS